MTARSITQLRKQTEERRLLADKRVVKLGNARVLLLAVSLDKNWRAVARMGYFAIYRREWVPAHRSGGYINNGSQAWAEKQRIGRRRPYHGAATIAKLEDFDADEHLAVIQALERRVYDSGAWTRAVDKATDKMAKMAEQIDADVLSVLLNGDGTTAEGAHAS